MSSRESGFGPVLRHAQDILSYVSGFTGYSPPRTQESVSGFGTCLTATTTANGNATTAKHNWVVAVAQRLAAFRDTPGSVDKLLPLIAGSVESQYGKDSVEYKSVAALVRRMRTSKLIHPPADPAPTDPTAAAPAAAADSGISHSERSFGSMTHLFNDLKTTLAGFTGYNPSNASIKLAALTTLSATLTTLNNAVATAYLNLQTARSTRLAAYADLHDRVKRIKAYVKAQYGTTSNEYKLIKGIRV